MKISEILSVLEKWAPPAYQESYDNAGLICGDSNREITGALVCLDSVEETIDEAIELNCNLIIAHHPIVFSGIKKLTGKNYVQRTLIKAIKNDIAIYAAHTNLDSIQTGVNLKIGELLNIDSPEILLPKPNSLMKLVTYCPTSESNKIRTALFEAGAGQLGNYNSCSFNTEGEGTFKGLEKSNQYVGNKHELHTESETKIEVILEKHLSHKIVNALIKNHPYEEVAYELYDLQNDNSYVGAGMIGELEQEITLGEFFDQVKATFNLKVIRHTGNLNQKIRRISWCGGSGSFLLNQAKRKKSDIFITGDFKYHEFFDHENQIVIADIGHYESEQFTQQLIVDFLKKNFNKFAVHLTGHNTNPVNYY
ncbi:MAG: Nif3-like dinuclear metal center hexameric protein [Salibacteraceae bacterium]